MQCTTSLYCSLLQCIVLKGKAMLCIALQCIVLKCSAMLWFVLQGIVLKCSTMECIVLECSGISNSPHSWLIFSSWIGHVLLSKEILPIFYCYFLWYLILLSFVWSNLCLFGQYVMFLCAHQQQFCCQIMLIFLAAITNWCGGNFEEEHRPAHLSCSCRL